MSDHPFQVWLLNRGWISRDHFMVAFPAIKTP